MCFRRISAKASLARAAVSFAVALFAALPLRALEMTGSVNGVYSFPNRGGYSLSGFIPPDYSVTPADDTEPAQRNLGNGWGNAEIKASFSAVGEILPAGKMKAKATAELSPVSVNGVGQVSFAPLSFAVLEGGAGIGTGWSVGPIGGLGINPEDPSASAVELTPLAGAVFRAWGGVTLQFDYAAIRPGPWNHIVAKASCKTEYRKNTAASDGEAWMWEADGGENFNGFRLIGAGFLGYQMPRRFNLVGLSFESTESLGDVREYSPMSKDGGWGSDFRSVRIGLVTGFRFGGKDSLVFLTQLRRNPDYTDGTVRLRDFRRRDYEGVFWSLNRIVVLYSHTF